MTEDYELFKRYKETHDKKLKEELTEKYMYMAHILSYKYRGCGIEYDDMYQVACIGLVIAIERFDPDRGVQFASFATPTILGEIRRFLRDKAHCIRVPRNIYDIFWRAENMKRHMDGISLDELAYLLDIPPEKLNDAYNAGDAEFLKSLEDEAFADGGMSVSNLIGKDDEGYTLIEDTDFMNYFKSKLNETENEIINLRFYEGFNQSETAKRMQISQVSVSRLEKKIVDKLKKTYSNGYEMA